MINQNIKIIRLQTGEDIVAHSDELDDDCISLVNPMRLIFRRMPNGQAVMMMIPWLPVELIKEDSAIIYLEDIITVLDPKESMIEYYQNLISKNMSEDSDSDDFFDGLLSEEEQELQQELNEELTERFDDVKNRTLH